VALVLVVFLRLFLPWFPLGVGLNVLFGFANCWWRVVMVA
jgi:hypothetical protein